MAGDGSNRGVVGVGAPGEREMGASRLPTMISRLTSVPANLSVKRTVTRTGFRREGISDAIWTLRFRLVTLAT